MCYCCSKVGEIEAAEKEKMREKCNKIINHGINCFINRQLIYNFPEEIFADAGGLSDWLGIQWAVVHRVISCVMGFRGLRVSSTRHCMNFQGSC